MDKLVLDTIKGALFDDMLDEQLVQRPELMAAEENAASRKAKLVENEARRAAHLAHLGDAGYDTGAIMDALRTILDSGLHDNVKRRIFLDREEPQVDLQAGPWKVTRRPAGASDAYPLNPAAYTPRLPDAPVWGISSHSCVSAPVAGAYVEMDLSAPDAAPNFEEADHAFVKSIFHGDWEPLFEGVATGATWHGIFEEGVDLGPVTKRYFPPTMFAVWGIEYREGEQTLAKRGGWLKVCGYLAAGVELGPLRDLRHAVRLAIAKATGGPIRFLLTHAEVLRGGAVEHSFWQTVLRIPFEVNRTEADVAPAGSAAT